MHHLSFAGFPPATVLALVGSALVAGLARGFSGFGGALIFVPLASAAIGPKLAAPLLLIVDGVAALTLLPNAWSQADKREVGTMSLGALAGVPLGTYVLTQADPVLLRWAIVLLVASLLALLLSGWRYRGRPSTPLTLGVGAIAGLASGAAQVGGPPVVAYWLGAPIPGETVRANVVLYFAISTVLTTLAYLTSGLITGTVLALAVASGPLYGLGLYAGSRLFGRASEAAFRRACYGLIAGAVVASLPVLDALLR